MILKMSFFPKIYILLASIILTVNCQDPRVRITDSVPISTEQKTMVTFRDKDFWMDCYVENLYTYQTVRWQRQYYDSQDNNRFKTQFISEDTALNDNIHYSLEKPTQYTWRLRVRGAQLSDVGKYICFVQLTQVNRAEDSRTVSVVYAPYLDPQMTSPDTRVKEGENFQMLCNASGYPAPTILWSRLGGQLLSIGQEKYESPVLPLKNIQARDRGTYMCSAINTIGKMVHNIQLDVTFKPIITTSSNAGIVQQAVGYRVELQCFIEANPIPKQSMAAWLKGTTTFSVSTDAYSINWIQGAFNRLTFELVIYNVQPSDFGTYTCRVSNEGDTGSQTSTASITLQQTTVPQNSIKLGRPIPGKERPELSSTNSVHAIVFMSVGAVLLASLLTC